MAIVDIIGGLFLLGASWEIFKILRFAAARRAAAREAAALLASKALESGNYRFIDAALALHWSDLPKGVRDLLTERRNEIYVDESNGWRSWDEEAKKRVQ